MFARFHLVPVKAQHTYPRPGHEPRGIIGEEQDPRVGQMTVLQETAASQDLLVARLGPELRLVAGYHLGVYVRDGGALLYFVLVTPLVLVILER